MAKLSDLLPNPIKTLTAPFKKREGMPWAQGTARNFGHAAFGDKIGNYVDERFLGDLPPNSKIGGGMTSAPQMQMGDSTQNPLMALMVQMMRQKGAM